MIQEQQEQPEVTSFYVPYLSFGKKASHLITTKYIEPMVKEFFKKKGVKKYEPIDLSKYISDLDFEEEFLFSYFYDNILADIEKQSGNIHHTIKYGITFDEEVTSKTCEITEIKYDEILLNKETIFYFIYFDLKDIMRFLRQQDRNTLKNNNDTQSAKLTLLYK